MKYVFGNWKMYLDYEESVALAKTLVAMPIPDDIRVAVFPSFLATVAVGDMLAKTEIALGAQNCSWAPKGAYTGAVSALQLKEVGCQYVLVGHSERRHIFGETDTAVRKKIEAAFDVGLIPIVCVGETKEEKASDKRQYRLKKQLMKVFEGLDMVAKEIIVAYEPVWAIASGEPCSPADAEDVLGWIRLELAKYTSRTVPTIYGGSVEAKNVLLYTALPSVDGVLIGTMSIKQETFAAILRAL